MPYRNLAGGLYQFRLPDIFVPQFRQGIIANDDHYYNSPYVWRVKLAYIILLEIIKV